MPWYWSFIVTPQGTLRGLRWMLKKGIWVCVSDGQREWLDRYGGFRNCIQNLHTLNALLTSWKAYCMVGKSYSSGVLVLVVGSEHFTFRSVRTIFPQEISWDPYDIRIPLILIVGGVNQMNNHLCTYIFLRNNTYYFSRRGPLDMKCHYSSM